MIKGFGIDEKAILKQADELMKSLNSTIENVSKQSAGTGRVAQINAEVAKQLDILKKNTSGNGNTNSK